MSGGGCERIVEALSARLDGEDPGVADVVVATHLERCSDCRRLAASLTGMHRHVRVRAAESVPDRTAAIVGAATASSASQRRRRRPSRVVALAVGISVVAAVVGFMVADPGGTQPAVTVRHVGGPVLTSARYPGATVLPTPAAKPDLVLTDTSGRPFDLSSATRSKVTVLYFGYTHCPDVCPITMALTARALQAMPAATRRAVTVVFVTTDPDRDTPGVIRTWLDAFDPSFVGLTGSPASIEQAEEQVGMPLSYATSATAPGAGSYTVVHAGYSLIYSQDGMAHLQVDDAETAGSLAVTLEHLVGHGFDPH